MPYLFICSYIQSLDKSLEQVHLVAMVMDEDTGWSHAAEWKQTTM